MHTEQNRSTAVNSAVWHILFLVSIAGIVAAMTILYRSMRSVMAVGGSCGSGGPFVIRVECPDGIPVLMNIAVWGGLILFFVAMAAIVKLRAPNLLWLLWPALFLSLGFNFIQFGLDPPGGQDPVGGWIVCGVLFGLMGGVPLLIGLPIMFRGKRRRTARLADRALELSTRFRNATTPPNVIVSSSGANRSAANWSAPSRSQGSANSNIVAALERLAALHRSGSLTDTEYQAAKDAVLGGGG